MAMVVDMLAQLAAQKRVTGHDALAARAVLYADMQVSADEAASLFDINARVLDDGPQWRELFVEAMTDYLVRQQEPRGYVDEAKADWLEDWILADGQLRGQTELELLVYVLEQAGRAPASLYRLALQHVRSRARARPYDPGEVELIRRILTAFAGSAASVEDAQALNDAELELFQFVTDEAAGLHPPKTARVAAVK